MADSIDVDINVNMNNVDEVDELTAKLQESTSEAENLQAALSGTDANISADVEVDDSQLDETQAKLDEMNSEEINVPVNTDDSGIDETKGKIDDTADSISGLGEALAGLAGAEIFSQISTGIMELAESTGTYNDSMMRASLEAEGAGISAGNMKNAVSSLSDATGRAGGQIREAFITATARGITNMNSFQTMMKGAGAQATLFGTDIESMANKFSQMAMRNTLMERSLASTGITMAELATAMGMTGATADEVKEKWKELDTNQRAAILGQAASMNEGKNANEEYKNSWAGLQEQMDMATAKLMRVAGQVFLPVLIPAIKAAGNVLNWFSGVFDSIMKGPLGGFISILGSVGAAIALAIPAYMALSAAFTFVTGPALAAASAIWAALAPLLPFIAIGAAIVFIIFEIGKAFGWWTDVGSMIDHIGDGLQRLWSAFINHPDVQAALQAISSALQWVWEGIVGCVQALLEFFGVSTGGEFDVVGAIIMGVGMAWDTLKTIIMGVVTVLATIIDVTGQVLNGQMDLQTALMTIWTTFQTNLAPILMQLALFVARIFVQMGVAILSVTASFIGGVIARFMQLPLRIAAALMAVIARVAAWGQSLIQSGIQAATGFVNGVRNTIAGVVGAISSALSGVVGAITRPFQQAYDKVKGIIDSIKSAAGSIGSYLGASYYGVDFGGEGLSSDSTLNNTLSAGVTNTSNTRNANINNNFYGLVEESAAEYIINTVNERLRKENMVRGV